MIKKFENFINESRDYGYPEIKAEELRQIIKLRKLRDCNNIIFICHWIVDEYIRGLLKKYESIVQEISCPTIQSDNVTLKEIESAKEKIFLIPELQRATPDAFEILMNGVLENKDSIFILTINDSDKENFDNFMEHFSDSAKDRFDKIYKVVLE